MFINAEACLYPDPTPETPKQMFPSSGTQDTELVGPRKSVLEYLGRIFSFATFNGLYSLRCRWPPEPKILDRLFTLQDTQRGTVEGLAELVAPGMTTGRASGVPEELWLDLDGVADA